MWATLGLTALGGLGTCAFVLNLLYPWLKYDLKVIWVLGKMAARVLKASFTKTFLIDIFEERVKQNPQKPFLIFQDNIYTYEYMNEQMNKVLLLHTQ
jgi:solute carrier family 27 fatty acid transporter 2/solute carrier family 27 fatty acid transporter 6